MDSNLKSLDTSIKGRIKSYFDNEDPAEIVRRSEQLMLYTAHAGAELEVSLDADGPVLIHPRPRLIPLSAYLASALTGLSAGQQAVIVNLSEIVSMVCRSVDIDLYEPRNATDPVHNASIADGEVFKIDRHAVVGSDLVIHLCNFPSTGGSEELRFAHEALVPIILIAKGDHRVSGMVTGNPSVIVDIRYENPKDLRPILEDRLLEIRPLLEQRRLAKSEFSENVVGSKIKELRLDANLSKEALANRVGISVADLVNIEENIDTVSNPSLTKLRLIATALKTTVAELVNPDYHESIMSSIQSLMSEQTNAAAARFRGVSDKDKRAFMRRFLARVSNELEERWHGL